MNSEKYNMSWADPNHPDAKKSEEFAEEHKDYNAWNDPEVLQARKDNRMPLTEEEEAILKGESTEEEKTWREAA